MAYSVDELRDAVRSRYQEAARSEDSCCGGGNETECGCGQGYSAEELQSVPADANLGLGCGNPTVFAELKAGESVLDLGSGGGLDCLLAAQHVGPAGSVIGVDMTPEMIQRAREAAERSGASNVSFRLGEIEALPAADASVDAVISNCVVNLSPEKARVFAEAFRVLKPGGRLAISDIVAERPATAEERADMELYSACISGAEQRDTIIGMLEAAGFEQIEVEASGTAAQWDGDEPAMPVYSAIIRAQKPPA